MTLWIVFGDRGPIWLFADPEKAQDAAQRLTGMERISRNKLRVPPVQIRKLSNNSAERNRIFSWHRCILPKISSPIRIEKRSSRLVASCDVEYSESGDGCADSNHE